MGPLHSFWASTIGKKIVMAITGLILVGFVIAHLLGNLQVFLGPARFNGYAHFLKSLGELLWLARLVLLVAVVLHIVAAVQLSKRRLDARPVGYRGGSQREVSTFAARYIRWGGAIILLFVIFHLLQFTTLTLFPGYSEWDVYNNVVAGFSVWWIVLLYVISMIALGLHLYHGIWGSMRTIGAYKPDAHPLRRPVALTLAVLVWAGFTIIPIAVFAGWVRPQPAVPPGQVAAPTATTLGGGQ